MMRLQQHPPTPNLECTGLVVGQHVLFHTSAPQTQIHVVNVVDEVKRTAFQVEYDPERSTGYCVTWSLLYMHYRILNPDTSETALIKHIDHKITTRFLLRYARKVEETLKGYS